MRTSRRTIIAFVLGALPLAPAFGFDGSPVNAPVNQAAPLGVVSPQSPTVAKPLSNKPVPPVAVPTAAAPTVAVPTASNATSASLTSLTSLQYAAEGGHPVAQWKLGRMYADGDGVAQDDLRAFEYFSRIANQHAEDNPGAPQAGIVANAFVALGRYYLSGIPNSKVKPDEERAREMFNYAASYFGNADAQYDLARLYFKSTGNSPESFRQGIRWLGLAAQKGQYQAQALLGQMLFNGEQMPPQRARGLMWLTLARKTTATTTSNPARSAASAAMRPGSKREEKCSALMSVVGASAAAISARSAAIASPRPPRRPAISNALASADVK